MAGRGKKPEYEDLEQYKHQFFQWVYIDLVRPLSKVQTRFNKLFDEECEAIGTRRHVTIDQWQTRKRRWDAEWAIGKGGPSAEVLEELDELPLWYRGEARCKQLNPPTILEQPPSTSIRYEMRRKPGEAPPRPTLNKYSRDSERTVSDEAFRQDQAPPSDTPVPHTIEIFDEDNPFDINQPSITSDPMYNLPSSPYNPSSTFDTHRDMYYYQPTYNFSHDPSSGLSSPWTPSGAPSSFHPSPPHQHTLSSSPSTTGDSSLPMTPTSFAQNPNRKRPPSNSFFVPPLLRKADNWPRTA